MMTLVQPTGGGSFDSMHRESAGCRCVPDIVGTAELQGDELIIDGKERGRRDRT